MNNFNETYLSSQESIQWHGQTIEKDFAIYKKNMDRMEKIKIQIKFTLDEQIIYSQNGDILRVVECQNVFEKPEIFNNMEQIQSLSWQGQYGQNKKKDGKWIAFWNKELLKNVGGQSQIIIYILYYGVGKKQGVWKDLFLNFMNKAQIFEIGEFYNGFRVGRWNYLYQEQKIGGGSYNKDGEKQGKWIELDEGFYYGKQVTYQGEYNMNGMKLGSWDIIYYNCDDKEYKQMQIQYKFEGKCIQINSGGGSYNQEGNEKKIGKWVELFDGFQYYTQVICNGEYNMNGMKVSRWDIMYCKCIEKKYKQMQILIKFKGGGGQYDQEGNQKKIGEWIVLDEGFYFYKQVTHNGYYNINGMKIGRWDILYSKYLEEEFNQIGGGSYDQEGNEKKIGRWVEIVEGFDINKQVTYNGEYNMNSIRVGRWDIIYCQRDEKIQKQIGGGYYDQEGSQKKIGLWVEIDKGFRNIKQVTHNGNYNTNGMKIGRWDIMYCKYNEQEYQLIGGGQYDQEGNQKKIGQWVEIDEGFRCMKQVTHNGDYNINGRKVGKWDILFCNYYESQYRKIGGGLYDEEGNQKKIGKWVELDQDFNDDSYSSKQVTYNGKYNMNGIKIGRWDIMYYHKYQMEYIQIGGGSYDEVGSQTKIGSWVELHEGFSNSQQITINGEYNMQGQKIGIWVELNLNQQLGLMNFDI